jgi:DNA-binding transcriptional regulator YiaG
MNDAKALAEMQRLAGLGRVRYSRHARQRMAKRDVKRPDVVHALRTATAAVWQADHQTWRVSGGVDGRGDELVCVVDLEADVVIIRVLSEESMRCPSCRKTDTFQPWRGPLELIGFAIEAIGERCSHCGEIVFSGDEVERQDELLDAAILGRGIRTSHEFRRMRKGAFLKATELAELFDVRPETVSRWESGALPIPRLAAFALAEICEHPRAARAKLETLARPLPRTKRKMRASARRG